MKHPIRIGILTASDMASAVTFEDLSVPAIVEALQGYLEGSFDTVRRLVPDEFDAIEKGLLELCHHEHCCLGLTTGGTGPAPRDVTPEVTEAVCEKIIPGFGERMRAVSFAKVPTAILSRQTAGVRGKSLIINLPGKPQAIRECLDAVFGAVPDCVDQIGGPKLVCKPHLKPYRHKEA